MNIIFILMIILIAVISAITTQKQQKKLNYNDFTKKNKLITDTEQKFYTMLNEIAKKHNLLVFSQVAINQLIKSKNYKALNKIGGKSVDFVLTDNQTNIKLCIELDDYTHKNKDRIKRDEFINNLFKQVDIKLLRIPIDNAFIVERIEKQITESL